MQVLCDVYNLQPDDPKIVSESEGILQAIELETLHGEYKWSQILKRDEVQTGKRVLLAYGMQFMNQMGGINLVVVSGVYLVCESLGWAWLIVATFILVLCDLSLAVQCWSRPKTESLARGNYSNHVRDWYVLFMVNQPRSSLLTVECNQAPSIQPSSPTDTVVANP